MSRITAASDACPACPEFRLIIPPTPQTILYIIQQQFLHQRRASPRSCFAEIPIMVSQRILVAIDGSEAGQTALNWTLKHLKVDDISLDVVTGVGMPVVQLCDGTHIHLTLACPDAHCRMLQCCLQSHSTSTQWPQSRRQQLLQLWPISGRRRSSMMRHMPLRCCVQLCTRQSQPG